MDRQRLARALWFLALVQLLGCAASYPTPMPPPPLGGVELPRFDQVSRDVYRSAQPSLRQLAQVQQRYGIRSVIKLNRGSDPELRGVTVVQHALDAYIEPSREELEQILRAIDEAEKPVLIHCTHGEDRTGLIVALYKMRRLGTPVSVAYADMMRRGFHPFPGLFRAWVREVGWNREESLDREGQRTSM